MTKELSVLEATLSALKDTLASLAWRELKANQLIRELTTPLKRDVKQNVSVSKQALICKLI